MYEELASDGSTRMVGTLEDIQNQYKLKQRSRDTSNSKVDDEFISDMWSVMDRAGNLLISKHHDYGPLNIARSPGGPINGLREIIILRHKMNHYGILLWIYLTIQLLQLWY
jgi:hypothetical protein